MVLFYALIVFGVAAVGGVIMANRIYNGNLAPWALSLVHMVLGATGLVLVLLAVLGGGGGFGGIMALIAFGVLLVAALGGFLLASMHLRKKLAPIALVLIHAGAGGLGIAFLILGVASLFGIAPGVSS